MKYFFLTNGWVVGRVWASDGLWSETSWRRKPDIQRINLCLGAENSPAFQNAGENFRSESEKLWLYRVEDAVLTVEVKLVQPEAVPAPTAQTIGQVVLKRLITAEQVIERLGTAEATCQLKSIQSVTL